MAQDPLPSQRDQILRGVERSKTVVTCRGRADDRAEYERAPSVGTYCSFSEALASKRPGAAGLADSSTGHSSAAAADIEVVPSAG